MESIRSNTSFVTRTFDYTQAARRKREEDQDAAAKADLRPAGQHANQVNFSQAAQIRLSQEISQEANRAQAVRVANNAKAAEDFSRALRQEATKAVQVKSENSKLSAERNQVEKVKSDARIKLDNRQEQAVRDAAAAAKKERDDTSAKAVGAQLALAEGHAQRTVAIDKIRVVERQSEVKVKLAEKTSADEVAKNAAYTRKVNADAVAFSKVTKAADAQARSKADKALKMYNKVSGMA